VSVAATAKSGWHGNSRQPEIALAIEQLMRQPDDTGFG
jgi:hypothetical protein